MARLGHFFRAVASGYLLLVVNIVYSLGSIPLALKYLSAEEFGLWAAVTQIAGYLALVDFGMSSAFARLLIEYKDQRDSTEYGSLIQSAWLVLLAQSLIIVCAGSVLSFALGPLLRIPPSLAPDFTLLLLLQTGLSGLSFATKMFPQLLYAHHRLDIVNYGQSSCFALSFVVLWLCFYFRSGVYSIQWAQTAGFVFMTLFCGCFCLRLGLFPSRHRWGQPSRGKFQQLFSFGKDIFLITIGAQLLMASQTLILTRALGLETAAIWTVCTRAFNLVYQVCLRPFDMTFTLFSEMIVRHEGERLRERFESIVILTYAFSAIGAAGVAFCNADFVALLSRGVISWGRANDVLLSIWLLSLTVNRCHGYLIQATKEIRHYSYMYFAEALAFVVFATVTVRHGGTAAILLASIGCSSLFTASYGLRRTLRYLDLTRKKVFWDWSRPAIAIIAVLALFGAILSAALKACHPLTRFSIIGTALTATGIFMLGRLGLRPALREELRPRIPTRLRGGYRIWAGREDL